MRVDFLLNAELEDKTSGDVTQTPKSVMWTGLGETGGTPGDTRGGKSSDVKGRKRSNGGGSDGNHVGANGKEKKFECELCGFGFGMRSNLKRHVMTVHEDRREWRCDICGAAFGLKQNLGTHVRVKHEKKRPFACEVCGACFGYKQVLQNHRRNIHGVSS